MTSIQNLSSTNLSKELEEVLKKKQTGSIEKPEQETINQMKKLLEEKAALIEISSEALNKLDKETCTESMINCNTVDNYNNVYDYEYTNDKKNITITEINCTTDDNYINNFDYITDKKYDDTIVEDISPKLVGKTFVDPTKLKLAITRYRMMR